MKTYGLLGKDISYSLSPAMHNAAFKALNVEAEYKIFDKAEEELDSFFTSLREGEVAGCNVTIPYKEKALDYVEKKDNVVESIGSLNTVVKRGGILEGHNTDHDGFVNALTGKENGDLNFDPNGKNVFVFGAGGAAKAVLFTLLGWTPKCVKKIVIADIDTQKAERLADYVSERLEGDTVISVAERSQYEDFISNSDLLVNATPCGMKETDPPLFDYKNGIRESLYVFDLIYVKDTPLVKGARASGAKAINGLNMLLYQAAASFKIWTKVNAPIEIMRKALLKQTKD